ncbi:hypothetical protein EV189_1858 [Motilibacter rhizosphaerae]|uniref:DUF2071 domain-containing protein n=1 Tax=Motilibacter rhizosphaerae TaxID=598652 RepID=A0A4Q7NSR5_9ACTN|nr:DUF2071 domain-containing protein [Motilibacter rhizosphaerae]RZS90075.1 hypothetical protein EV189_1858 [Motilibacter rhizosphaerae]
MAALPVGFPVAAPPLGGPAVLGQQWRDLAFLHWRVDSAAVAPFFPRGSRPDEHDGSTWVGLVPFSMVGAGLGRRFPVPWLGTFLETNVRLYSVDDEGRHGVVFRSLDADRLLPVLGAQAVYGLPYRWARMTAAVDGDERSWSSVRRRGGGSLDLRLRVGQEVEPDDLDVFLTARWGLHAAHLGRTWWVPNEHGPWPLRSAEVLELRDSLCAEAGVEVAGLPERVRFTSGVRTVFGVPQLVR